jgi:hypothetical protein
MIQVTGAAASSIALRNAIFRIIPKAYYEPAVAEAKLTCLGKNKTMAERRKAAIDWFKKAGATEEQVYEVLGIKGQEDIGNEELVTLRGMLNAIKEGTLTLESVLAGGDDKPGSKVQESSLNDKIKGKKQESPKVEDKSVAHAIPEGASELLVTWWKSQAALTDETELRALCDEAADSAMTADEKNLFYAEINRRIGK